MIIYSNCGYTECLTQRVSTLVCKYSTYLFASDKHRSKIRTLFRCTIQHRAINSLISDKNMELHKRVFIYVRLNFKVTK